MYRRFGKAAAGAHPAAQFQMALLWLTGRGVLPDAYMKRLSLSNFLVMKFTTRFLDITSTDHTV